LDWDCRSRTVNGSPKAEGRSLVLLPARSPAESGSGFGAKPHRDGSLGRFASLPPAPRPLDARWRGARAQVARELAGDARHGLDLPARGEALVEAFGAEIALEVGPRREALLPATGTPLDRIAVFADEIDAHAQHRLERHGPRDHVTGVAPRRAPHPLGGLEEVA